MVGVYAAGEYRMRTVGGLVKRLLVIAQGSAYQIKKSLIVEAIFQKLRTAIPKADIRITALIAG